jgi:hypothetical protein
MHTLISVEFLILWRKEIMGMYILFIQWFKCEDAEF